MRTFNQRAQGYVILEGRKITAHYVLHPPEPDVGIDNEYIEVISLSSNLSDSRIVGEELLDREPEEDYFTEAERQLEQQHGIGVSRWD